MNLKAEMAKLPELTTTLKPPHWEYWRHQLWQLAQEREPDSFVGWPCVYHTMLVNHWSMEREWEYLLNHGPKLWNHYPLGFGPIIWPTVVRPHTGYPIDYFQGTPYSANMINQAYHIALWENATGQRISQLDTIVEFGGGYGAMALLCHRLGFRGKYVIYDLPEFSLLQQWFLEQEGIDNVQWPKKWGRRNADLLIALYSLSETPVEGRDRFLKLINAKSYIFLFSSTWEAYNNLTYFSQFADSKSLKWHTQQTPREIDSYLMGWE